MYVPCLSTGTMQTVTQPLTADLSFAVRDARPESGVAWCGNPRASHEARHLASSLSADEMNPQVYYRQTNGTVPKAVYPNTRSYCPGLGCGWYRRRQSRAGACRMSLNLGLCGVSSLPSGYTFLAEIWEKGSGDVKFERDYDGVWRFCPYKVTIVFFLINKCLPEWCVETLWISCFSWHFGPLALVFMDDWMIQLMNQLLPWWPPNVDFLIFILPSAFINILL